MSRLMIQADVVIKNPKHLAILKDILLKLSYKIDKDIVKCSYKEDWEEPINFFKLEFSDGTSQEFEDNGVFNDDFCMNYLAVDVIDIETLISKKYPKQYDLCQYFISNEEGYDFEDIDFDKVSVYYEDNGKFKGIDFKSEVKTRYEFEIDEDGIIYNGYFWSIWE